MKSKKQLALGATENGGTTPQPTPNSKTTPLIPTKQADLLSLADSVNTKWASIAALTLLWITQKDFAKLVTSLSKNLGDKTLAAGGRQAKTQTLKTVNKKIDDAVKEVKVYIEKKFKKANAAAQFGRYGIIKETTGSYSLPKYNDKRKLALPLMIKAIADDGMGAEEFGTTFWNGVNTDFSNALKDTTSTTKDISDKVNLKDADIEKIIKVLNSILKLIEANYPNTYEQEYRAWGFIKQNY